MNKGGYASEETIVLRRWESVTVLFSIINRVGNTLEKPAFKPFTVASLRYQLSW